MQPTDPPLYLRIAPELYLKRLIVGGLDAVMRLESSLETKELTKRT